MNRKSKRENMWAIKSGNLLLPFSIRTTRRQCVNDYIGKNYTLDEFNKSVKNGWHKIVKVTVIEQ